MQLRTLELLLLFVGIPGTLTLAWRRPPPDGRRSSAVTVLLWVLALGAGVMVLIGLRYATVRARQDHRDPSAEFAGLGVALGAILAIAGGVLLLTFLAALVIRALRK